MIMKIIILMKEVRELRDPEQQTTSTGQETTLETLLQAKEREYSNALAEIDELQKTLRLKTEKCSGLEERYQQAKTELDKKIAELNKAGDSKEALILDLINLKNDLKAIEALISNTDDLDSITELKRQLEQKQDKVIFKTAEIEKVFANPRIILTIIELQDDIRDLQKKAANETNDADMKGLQNRLDDLLSQIDDKDNENTKLMLTIMALQIQVEYLQKQLSERHRLQAAQVTELTTELTDKRKELQKYVSELTEKNQTNAELILKITDLQNKLRNLEKVKVDEAQTTSSRIAKLKEQLKDKEEERDRDQAEIEALQNKLNQTEAQCSNYEQKLRDLQNDLDEKMKELESKSNSVTSLALQISTLSLQIEELKNQLENTESKSKIRELEAIIEEKNKELEKKKEELRTTSAQPRRLLQIIELQIQIEKLSNVAANESDYFKIQALQDHLNHLINGIQDENNENTKLTFQILAQQDEIARLKKQEKKQIEADLEKIKELENELDDVRNQIKEKTALLESSDLRVTNLSTQITELHKKLKPLEDQISDVKNTNTEKLAEIQKRLELTKRQLQDSERQLNDADTKNYNLLMEIAELRAQLKKAEKKPPKVDGNKIKELEQQLQTQQREKKILESTNNALQNKLNQTDAQCSSYEQELQEAKTELDKKIAELNKVGDSKEALILDLINLKNDLKAIEALISNTDDLDSITELKRQLEQKQDKVIFKTAEIEKVFANPRIILTIIELQDDIRDLQKKAANETNDADMKGLQNRLDDLLSQIDDKDNEDTKLMLTIMALQIQVEYLQKQLSERHTLQAAQVTELTTELTDKRKELQKYVSELTEKNQTNAELILTITDLQNKLRNLEKEKVDEAQTTSSRIAKLKEQLKDKEEEHSRDQAEIEALQNKLNQTEAQCSNYEQKLRDLQNDLDDKMKELESKSNSVTSLALQISTLSLQIEELKNQLENTESKSKIRELEAIIEEKNKELEKKKEELRTTSAQPRRLLQIIELQMQIEKLSNVAANESDYFKIQALQDHLNHLINGIQDENNENTKLTFQILAQQDEIARLKKQEKKQIEADLEKIKELENELDDVRNQIKEKTALLESSDLRVTNLSTQITELHKKLKPLEDQISDVKNTNTEKLAEIQKRLELTKRQLQDSERQLNDADAKNYNLLMEIAELRAQLKKAEKKPPKVDGNKIKELEQQLQTQQREKKILERTNNALQNKLNQTDAQCSSYEQELQEAKTELDKKIAELNKAGDSKEALKLKEQLKDKEEEHSRDQAEIEALQNKLNQTEAQCSNYEQKLRDLQNDLDDKMKELESKSNSVTSLAIQISTLSLQIEELKDQLENTESKSKIRELEAIIEEKNKELEKKKEELRTTSAQPRRLLQIIELQIQIEKLSNVAANESDYFKIQALQDHLNHLINGIQDENNENTKLTFQILAQQDEIARLKKQEKKQIEADLEKIKELENELDDVRNQIKEKTALLESSDLRVTNLSTQITELHKKLKPLEDQISDVKNTNTEKLAEIQKRLELTKRQLQDSERQLNDADAKNYNLLMEIAELRAQLKKAEKKPPKVDGNKIKELEQQLQTQQREKKILERTNNALQNKLNQTDAQCSSYEQELQEAKTELDKKIAELNKAGDSKEALSE
ncbi:myosin heavy chain, skeletal muscle, adult-like [Scomber japonicus]|uniref:myosin heavy chain, skeletal muscle, adult-like n=1 Tax=Scomber japonicus TaxID=13676 RepID=UPI002306CEA9|nr:myosin heavy chain, skeletal muscle, adult-like [Scomber japonicus]